MKLECPFHQSPLEEGSTCPKCSYKIGSSSENSHYFVHSTAKQGIYESYENAYEELAEDDLEASIYAGEYQSDLASETHGKIGSVAGLDVAELGVGQGFLQKEFLTENPRSLLALDIAEDYVLNSRKIFENSSNQSTRFRTSVGNVEFMPYNQCFDWVVATDILEHVLNLGNALVRIARSLRSGGRFACRVPYKEALGQYSIYNGQKYEFAHLRFFDESSLCTQLREAGLRPLQTYCYGYQSHRLRIGIPSFPSKVMGKLLSLSGLYGDQWHHFNRKSRTLHLRPLRMLHQPLELLVIAQKL